MATLPFFGVQPTLVDNDGARLEGPAAGNLVILDAWPGMMRTVYGDHRRFVQTYFTTFEFTRFFQAKAALSDEELKTATEVQPRAHCIGRVVGALVQMFTGASAVETCEWVGGAVEWRSARWNREFHGGSAAKRAGGHPATVDASGALVKQ